MTDTARLGELDRRYQAIERELALQIPEMNLEQLLRKADRRAIALSLPEGVALVEFVRFDVFDFHAGPARSQQRRKPARYLAFVLPSGEPDNLRMLDLGEAEPIDQMIRDFRAGITGEAEDRTRRDLVKHRPKPAPTSEASVGMALREVLFGKLTPCPRRLQTIVLAPDGNLARLPFEVLPSNTGRILIDDGYAFSYVSCGRDVLRFRALSLGQHTAALVAADPDFDFVGENPPPSDPSQTIRSRPPHILDSLRVPCEASTGHAVEGERIAATARGPALAGTGRPRRPAQGRMPLAPHPASGHARLLP